MVRLLLDRLLLVVIGCAVVLALAHQAAPEPKPLLIHADYQRCVTFKPAPLEPRKGVILYPNLKDVV